MIPETKRRFKNKVSLSNCVGLGSHHTHTLKPFEALYNFAMHKWIVEKKVATPTVIDPFARMCLWGTKRNDINPTFLHEYTTHCMDALEFMCNEPPAQAHIVLLDPPFSNRQSEEEYGTSNLYANPGYMSDIGLQSFRILKPGGYVIKCGYNTNPPYKGFTLVHVKVCQMGASKNDILMSIWQKTQQTLNVGLN